MLQKLFTLLLFLTAISCRTANNSAQLFRQGIVAPKDFTNPVGDTLTVLSWNVEHFVDADDNPYVRNAREDKPDSLMQGKPELLMQALLQADADVVVLQEFESVQYLQALADSFLTDGQYRYFADAESPDWYMNVVVMSRVPLGVVYSYGAVHTPVSFTDENNQPQYETQNQINTRMWSADVLVNDQYAFLLTGLHLKAGRSVRDEAMRVGQIRLLKTQFARHLRENPKKNLLVVGDLNSVPGSHEIAELLAGKAGNQFVDPLDSTVYTHPSDNPRRRLDHQLPNQNMDAELLSVTVPKLLAPEQMHQISDHLPVLTKFRTTDR